ncbi:MAG: PIN domain-containing protein [Bacteroidota bacterium]
MALIYLDTCAIQRPLDDRTQFRVRVEADAVTAVLSAAEAGEVQLLTSSALRAESSRIRDRSRLEFARDVLELAVQDVSTSEAIRQLTLDYQRQGMKPFDALHLASAVISGADYFCTTDDRFLRRAREANTQATHVVDPLELALALTL